MSDRTRRRKAPGETRAGRGRAATGNGGNRPGQKVANRTKAAQRAAGLRRTRSKDSAKKPEVVTGTTPQETGGPEAAQAVAADARGRETDVSAPATKAEAAPAQASTLSRGGAEETAPPAEAGDAVPDEVGAPPGGDEGGTGSQNNATSTAEVGNEDELARSEGGRGSRRPGGRKLEASAKKGGPNAPGGDSDQADERKTPRTLRRKSAKDAVSAPDEPDGGPRSGASHRRAGRRAQTAAGSAAKGKTDAEAVAEIGTGKESIPELEKSEESTPAAMPQAAPMPAAAALPGAASLSETVFPFGIAAAATPGLGLLPSPGSLPQPRDLVREMAEIAQIGMDANVAAARAFTAARTPGDVLESQVRSAQILAEAWMRQGSRLSDLWIRLLPGGR